MYLLVGASNRADRSNPFLPVVFFISPLVTTVTPRLTPLVLAVVAAVLIGAALRRGTPWQELLPLTPALAAFVLLGAYLFLNALWSVNKPAGFGKAAFFTGLMLMTFAAATAAATLDKKILLRAGLAFAAGAFVGAFFILVELLTDGLATRTLKNLIPFLHRSPKYAEIVHGKIARIALWKFNHNVNMVVFHLWPGLLALMTFSGARRMTTAGLFVVIVVAVVLLSEHGSSQVALLGSGLVVLLAYNWRRPVIRALAVLWCAAFALVIPASFVAYKSGLQFAASLPVSARQKVIIWEYTGEYVLRHPLLGSGIESTPVLSKLQKAAGSLERPEGFASPRTMGHHAHNMFLHSWSELGAVGALLLAIAGAAVVMLIPSLPGSAQPFAAGTFATFALVGSFAWGMWQSWFMCAIALLPVYLVVLSEHKRE